MLSPARHAQVVPLPVDDEIRAQMARGVLTQKELAARLNVSAQWMSVRVALLDLGHVSRQAGIAARRGPRRRARPAADAEGR